MKDICVDLEKQKMLLKIYEKLNKIFILKQSLNHLYGGFFSHFVDDHVKS